MSYWGDCLKFTSECFFFFDQNFSFLDNFCAIPLIVSSINKLIEIVQIVVIDNLHFESFHKKLTKMTDTITNQVKEEFYQR